MTPALINSIGMFEVSHAQRPTLSALCNKLEHLVRASKPVNSELPLGVQVSYMLNVRAYHRSKASGIAWHLRSPSAPSIASLSCEALVRGGYVQPGQVVQATGYKFLTDSSFNLLIVTIQTLDTMSQEDFKLLPHKLLEWYLEQCAIKNITPNRVAYKSLLKKLKNKPAKNGGQSYKDLDLQKILPKFIAEDSK